MSVDDLPGRVYTERKRLGMTQEQLAEKAGVSLRTYLNFEKRKSKPQEANLRAILAAVDISTEADDETAAATRSGWPVHRQVFLDMLGAYLGTMSEAQELEVIHDLTRQIFDNR